MVRMRTFWVSFAHAVMSGEILHSISHLALFKVNNNSFSDTKQWLCHWRGVFFHHIQQITCSTWRLLARSLVLLWLDETFLRYQFHCHWEWEWYIHQKDLFKNNGLVANLTSLLWDINTQLMLYLFWNSNFFLRSAVF